MIRVTIEKLVFGGQGLGRADNKVILAWNALPEEEVEVEIRRDRRTYTEGIARTILQPSPHRIAPEEDHFLSCGPWQILSWDQENLWKERIARETFSRIGHVPDAVPFEIISQSDRQYYYRNKVEYRFTLDERKRLSLAFFQRGTHEAAPITCCKLAEPQINEAAATVLNWLNAHPTPVELLKSVTVRSDNSNHVLVALFVRAPLRIVSPPPLNETMVGFHVYVSSSESDTAPSGKLVYSLGQDSLSATLINTTLKFGPLTFFQVNVPLFERVLDDIAGFLDPEKPVVDYYAGVGAICLPLSDRFKECLLVERHREAISYAEQNIQANRLSHCVATQMPAEKITEFITPDRVIVFDPPRAGLHRSIVQRILADKPLRIIYLSCNLSTQARDIRMLQSAYEIKFLRLYNFFPRTAHIEGLCVLDRRSV